MSITVRVVAAIVVAVIVGFGFRAYDMNRGAEWEVSPEQVTAGKAAGGAGYETRPGSVTVLPIRSETADMLPFKWALAGIGAGVLLFVATRHVARRADR